MKRFLVISALIWLTASNCPAGQNAVDEYRVKAAFLFNFAKFVSWPEEAFETGSEPLVIGVLGEDPFDEYLAETVKGKWVAGRRIELRYFARARDVSGCHILFISPSEADRLDDVLGQVSGKGVLTVGDQDRFAHNGGMVNLVRSGDRVTIEICRELLTRADLRASSLLLDLAVLVKCKSPEPLR